MLSSFVCFFFPALAPDPSCTACKSVFLINKASGYVCLPIPAAEDFGLSRFSFFAAACAFLPIPCLNKAINFYCSNESAAPPVSFLIFFGVSPATGAFSTFCTSFPFFSWFLDYGSFTGLVFSPVFVFWFFASLLTSFYFDFLLFARTSFWTEFFFIISEALLLNFILMLKD